MSGKQFMVCIFLGLILTFILALSDVYLSVFWHKVITGFIVGVLTAFAVKEVN